MTFRRLWPYLLTLLPIATDLVLILLSPRDGGVMQVGLTPHDYFLASLVSIVPFALAWLLGTRAVVTLFDARRAVAGNRLQTAYLGIGSGLAILLVGSALALNVSALRTLFLDDPLATFTLTSLFTIIGAYAPLVAFWLIFQASGKLRNMDAPAKKGWIMLALLAYLFAAFVYGWFLFTDPGYRAYALARSAPRLSELQSFLLIMVPSLLWTGLALGSIFRMTRYYNHDHGIARFHALSVVAGLGLVAIAFILQQLLFFTGVFRLSLVTPGALLIISFFALGFQLAGFVILAQGIRKTVRDERRERRA